MKKRIASWLALVVCSGSALLAQNITDTWQGTLQAGRELRIVIKISMADDVLKAVMHSIDQGGQGINATSISLQGTTVKMSIDGIGGKYEGKLNTDGNSIAGTWTQGTMPLELNLVRATAQSAWTIPEPPARPKPMAAGANPVFEVATIKPSRPDAQGKRINVDQSGRHFSTLNTSVSDLLTFAYGIHPRQITGAPAWLEADKFDLAGQPDGEGAPNGGQWKVMLQKLLADRFKLTFHRDKKELSVYTIVVAKGGTKLTKNESDPNGLPGIGFRGLGMLNARNANMADFANLMQSAVLERPVLDQTGLTGRFDFALNWTPDEFQFASFGPRPPAPPPADNAPPDLFTAIQQQIGLKLEGTKAPAEVLVIDRVEKPSEN